jgi:ABC-type glutathione transport system ATPase component
VQLLLEPFAIHRIPVDREKKVEELLQMVICPQNPTNISSASGGQARRGIAGLARSPKLIADEPTADWMCQWRPGS